MERITQGKKESRKDYLFRVALVFIEQSLEYEGTNFINIKYDGAECDGACLVEDMKIELGIDTQK